MLKFTVPATEDYDEVNKEFIYTEEVTLELEHSLVSLSKWESIWEKPFLGDDEKTTEETLSYIYCMTLSDNVTPEIIQRLTNDQMKQINNYIESKMSATWFNEKTSSSRAKEIITAEIIYYWMIALNIPLEWETRHLNRLFTLIKVCNQKNAPEKKMGKAEMLSQRQALNAKRKAAHKTSG